SKVWLIGESPAARAAGRVSRARRSGRARKAVRASDGDQVDRRFLAVAALLDFVLQALVLVERLHARRLHGGDVDEAVVAAVVGLDEAVAFVGVEEFACADRHDDVLSKELLVCPGAECPASRASGRQSKGSRRRYRAEQPGGRGAQVVRRSPSQN